MKGAPGRSKSFYFTIDVDWIPGSDEGLRRLLEFCSSRNIPATLFVAGRFAVDYPDLIAEAARNGHGIGCHGWEHGLNPEEDFLHGPLQKQREWIAAGSEAIATATGVQPVMFRAPNLWISETTLEVLLEAGYQLDSSVPAQRFDFGYGQCNYLKYFLAPLAPYRPDRKHLGRRGTAELIEIPPSAVACVPLNMTALRKLGLVTVAWAVRRLASRQLPAVFYLHPSEFVRPEAQQVPQSDPERYRTGTGPENLKLVGQFLDIVEQLGYRAGGLAELLDGRTAIK